MGKVYVCVEVEQSKYHDIGNDLKDLRNDDCQITCYKDESDEQKRKYIMEVEGPDEEYVMAFMNTNMAEIDGVISFYIFPVDEKKLEALKQQQTETPEPSELDNIMGNLRNMRKK